MRPIGRVQVVLERRRSSPGIVREHDQPSDDARRRKSVSTRLHEARATHPRQTCGRVRRLDHTSAEASTYRTMSRTEPCGYVVGDSRREPSATVHHFLSRTTVECHASGPIPHTCTNDFVHCSIATTCNVRLNHKLHDGNNDVNVIKLNDNIFNNDHRRTNNNDDYHDNNNHHDYDHYDNNDHDDSPRYNNDDCGHNNHNHSVVAFVWCVARLSVRGHGDLRPQVSRSDGNQLLLCRPRGCGAQRRQLDECELHGHDIDASNPRLDGDGLRHGVPLRRPHLCRLPRHQPAKHRLLWGAAPVRRLHGTGWRLSGRIGARWC